VLSIQRRSRSRREMSRCLRHSISGVRSLSGGAGTCRVAVGQGRTAGDEMRWGCGRMSLQHLLDRSGFRGQQRWLDSEANPRPTASLSDRPLGSAWPPGLHPFQSRCRRHSPQILHCDGTESSLQRVHKWNSLALATVDYTVWTQRNHSRVWFDTL